jgi:hypothetical protein
MGPSLDDLETALESAGAVGAATADYIREHRVRIGFRPQSAGARWTIDRRIELHPRHAPDLALSPYGLSLVVHEVRHLQQGAITALSVYGELDAWQVQFGFLRQMSVEVPGTETHRAAVGELLALDLGWDRSVLTRARRLMREYGGKAYRVDLLPLYPVHREIAYLLSRRRPNGA